MIRNNCVMKFYRHILPETGTKTAEDTITENIAMRQNLTEQQIDDTIEDSFPASDPPAWY
ncbi:MAG TPA: hypothetical protein VGF14_02205 [Alphaproteobacteria bacterium]